MWQILNQRRNLTSIIWREVNLQWCLSGPLNSACFKTKVKRFLEFRRRNLVLFFTSVVWKDCEDRVSQCFNKKHTSRAVLLRLTCAKSYHVFSTYKIVCGNLQECSVSVSGCTDDHALCENMKRGFGSSRWQKGVVGCYAV